MSMIEYSKELELFENLDNAYYDDWQLEQLDGAYKLEELERRKRYAKN